MHPEHKKKEIENSIQKAVGYILDVQMPDGSWYVHVLVYLILLGVNTLLLLIFCTFHFGPYGMPFEYKIWSCTVEICLVSLAILRHASTVW